MQWVSEHPDTILAGYKYFVDGEEDACVCVLDKPAGHINEEEDGVGTAGGFRSSDLGPVCVSSFADLSDERIQGHQFYSIHFPQW